MTPNERPTSPRFLLSLLPSKPLARSRKRKEDAYDGHEVERPPGPRVRVSVRVGVGVRVKPEEDPHNGWERLSGPRVRVRVRVRVKVRVR